METELNTVLETSKALSSALDAVRGMHIETIEDRERRLLEGRSSHTGWPIKRIVVDDGLTIPEKQALALRPVESARIATMMQVPLDERDQDEMNLPFLIWLMVMCSLLITLSNFL
jgi:hypothetical protein